MSTKGKVKGETGRVFEAEEKFQSNEERYWNARLKPLVGAEVIAAGVAKDDDGECWPMLAVSKNGKVFQVIGSRDDEGNGPGALDVHEIPSD